MENCNGTVGAPVTQMMRDFVHKFKRQEMEGMKQCGFRVTALQYQGQSK